MNEKAFPKKFESAGMDLRDYFAAAVMQGFCASGLALESSQSLLSVEAYEIADTMMEARKQ